MANPLLVYEGDSLTFGQTGPPDGSYPAQLNRRLLTTVDTVNEGTSGSTVATLNGRAATVDALIGAGRPWSVLCVWVGTNDIRNGGLTATQVYNALVTYCTNRRAAGYLVLVFTLLPRTDAGTPGTFEADRQTVSANIRANWATFADGLVDMALDPVLGVAGATTGLAFYNDLVHLTIQGYGRAADRARMALILLEPSLSMAISAAATWEVRASGAGVSDNNGGAYENVALFSGSDLVVDAAVNTRVTSASHSFVAADVGTRLLITAGSGWTTGYYTITSLTGTAANLAATPAAVGTTGGTWTEVGIDYSLQNAPQVALGGGVVTTSITTNVITFTGGTYTPALTDVGNYVQMLSGTNVTANSFFRITSVGATTWTMDNNVVSSGTTTNSVGNMGGALLTLTKLSTTMLFSNKAYGTGAFTNTGASLTFAQAGTPSGAAPASRLIGYGSVRGDSGHATLTLSVTAGLTGLNMTGAGWQIEQFDVDCASLATSTGMVINNFSTVRNCKIANATTRGIFLNGTSGTSIQDCELTTCSAVSGCIATNGAGQITRCYIHDNTGPGISAAAGATVRHNLIVNNTGATVDGIAAGSLVTVLSNTIHGNGRHGINYTGTNYTGDLVRNNILSQNGVSATGFGLVANATAAAPAMPDDDGNAYYNNNADLTSGHARSFADSLSGLFAIVPYGNSRDVILTASPYIGPTSGGTANFGLNAAAGGGAACKGTGTPGAFPGLATTVGRLDMGAVQSAGSGSAPGLLMATG